MELFYRTRFSKPSVTTLFRSLTFQRNKLMPPLRNLSHKGFVRLMSPSSVFSATSNPTPPLEMTGLAPLTGVTPSSIPILNDIDGVVFRFSVTSKLDRNIELSPKETISRKASKRAERLGLNDRRRVWGTDKLPLLDERLEVGEGLGVITLWAASSVIEMSTLEISYIYTGWKAYHRSFFVTDDNSTMLSQHLLIWRRGNKPYLESYLDSTHRPGSREVTLGTECSGVLKCLTARSCGDEDVLDWQSHRES